jgi:hypothetical protein
MTLRGIIIGVAVCLPATVFASASWSQSQPNRATHSYVPPYDATYMPPYDATYVPSYDASYDTEIRKSLERLNPSERSVIVSILAELGKKSPGDILRLKLETDVCQEIDCRGVSPTTARHYVEAYAEKRIADDTHQTALRSAAAAERNAAAAESNKHIAEAALGFSFLSLLISFLTFWRKSFSTKNAISA